MKWLKSLFRKPTQKEKEEGLLTQLDLLVTRLQTDFRMFRIIRTEKYWSVEVPTVKYQGYKTESATLNEAVSNMISIIEELLKDREKR